MLYEQAVAVVNLLVPENQMIERARAISTHISPLGSIRSVDDARNALIHITRAESDRALALIRPPQNPAAVALGSLGGKAGGWLKWWRSLTPEQQKAHQQKAVAKRWANGKNRAPHARPKKPKTESTLPRQNPNAPR